MDMSTYLNEIEHAASSMIEVVWSDNRRLEELARKIGTAHREMAAGYRYVESNLSDPYFEDEDGLATGAYWDTYFGADKEQHDLGKERAATESLATARSFSRSAQSGGLLQYAKQGISMVHGGLASCPAGRLIGTVSLRDAIWQGRNHAEHWEAGAPHGPVVSVFEALETEQDSKFGGFRTRNLALILWSCWDGHPSMRFGMTCCC